MTAARARIAAGGCAAGQVAEAKEGVDLGGAHRQMRDDDGPGPLTPASAA